MSNVGPADGAEDAVVEVVDDAGAVVATTRIAPLLSGTSRTFDVQFPADAEHPVVHAVVDPGGWIAECEGAPNESESVDTSLE